jgi:hypothetical protein
VADAVRQHRPPPEGLGDGQLLAALVIGHGWRELAESPPRRTLNLNIQRMKQRVCHGPGFGAGINSMPDRAR